MMTLPPPGPERLPRKDYHAKLTGNTIDFFTNIFQAMHPRRLRTMREFAQEEIIIPDGPHAGRPFKVSTQPYAGLFFDEHDTHRWTRFVSTGPSQSGKSLTCFVIPAMYYLFEHNESVICGLPDMSMARDKWEKNFRPAIMASRYREMLPERGSGARGGHVESIHFTNGASLRFMSGGGSDKSRAAYTARVLVITETDGMDTIKGTSREADPISQLEARTAAYGDARRIFMECTVSTEYGRTWREYQGGTCSRIMMLCPHCNEYVHLTRENLTGWDDAHDEIEAGQESRWACPSCGTLWHEQDRKQAAQDAVLLHKGQTISGNEIAGIVPPTKTLGFRWTAADNMFHTASFLGQEEWRAKNGRNPDTDEIKMKQFFWTIPVEPTRTTTYSTDIEEIVSLTNDIPRGVVPENAPILVSSLDIGGSLAYYMVMAVQDGFTPHVVDYGLLPVKTQIEGIEKALYGVMSEYKELISDGYIRENDPANKVIPIYGTIDSSWQTELVYSWCRQYGQGNIIPFMGHGQAANAGKYPVVKPTDKQIRVMGPGYHVSIEPNRKLTRINADADHWKTFFHDRLQPNESGQGVMSLFHVANPRDHAQLAQHWTAETKVQEFTPGGKGITEKWVQIRKQNHLLDTAYMCMVLAHLAGARIMGESRPAIAPSTPSTTPTRTKPRQVYAPGIRSNYR